MEKKKAFINSFDIQGDIHQICQQEQLQQIKKNFKISFNKDTGKIDVSQKFNAEPEKIDESVHDFERKVEKILDNFLNDFSNINFTIKG